VNMQCAIGPSRFTNLCVSMDALMGGHLQDLENAITRSSYGVQ